MTGSSGVGSSNVWPQGEDRRARRRLYSEDQVFAMNKAFKNRSKKTPLSFLHCNINGYVNNIKYVLPLLEKNLPTVLLLTTTHLDSTTSRSERTLPNYENTFALDRSQGRREGGMMVYTHSVQADQILELQQEGCEAIWLKVVEPDYRQANSKGSSADKVTVVGNVYSSLQKGGPDFLEYLEQSLAWLAKHLPTAQVVVQGCVMAYNQEWVQGTTPTNKDGERLRSILARQGLNMISGAPTWFHSASSGDCVDLFMTKDPLTAEIQLLDFQGDSQHKAVFVQLEKTFCTICNLGFSTKQELALHQGSPQHRRNYCLILYQKFRDKYVKNPHELGLELGLNKPDPGVVLVSANNDDLIGCGGIVVTTQPGVAKTFRVSLKNSGQSLKEGRGIVVESIEMLRNDPVIFLSDVQGITAGGKKKIRLLPKISYKVDVRVDGDQVGRHRGVLMVSFYHEEQSPIEGAGKGERRELSHTAIELLVKITTPEMADLAPTRPYVKPKPFVKWDVKETIKGPLPEMNSAGNKLDVKIPLDQFYIEDWKRKVIRNSFQLSKGAKPDETKKVGEMLSLVQGPLSPSNYKDRLHLLLHCEEMQQEFDVNHYNMEGVTMKKERTGQYRLTVPGLAENRPSVLKGDKLYIKQVKSRREFEGCVDSVENNDALLRFHPSFSSGFVNGMRYDVRFTINRYPLRNMHRGVELAARNQILPTLFPTQEQLQTTGSSIKPTDIIPFDRKISDNPNQLQAVRNIVMGTSGSAPYIVFGPPGTGKTVTVVEALKQVVRLRPSSHILAAAPSNAAADLLAQRIQGHIPKEKIRRIHAPSRVLKAIPKEILDISNCDAAGHFIYPEVSQLQKYSVIIVTLVTAGRLVSAQFPSDHFTHVFIDECGHAMEPEATIALSGILSSARLKPGGGGRVVLAGDPKQLGPVLRSVYAVKHDLSESLLERLMKKVDLYSAPYNPAAITKLVRNFRSHPALLSLPSRLFYNDELVPAGDQVLVNSMLKFPGLPDMARGKFPLIFHGVIGQDLKEEKSPSFFNPEEIVTVIGYVKKIMEMKENKIPAKEIGIICPYRRQVQKLREKLYSKGQQFKEITVGSTEEFQGQERRVMIISCVRSSPQYVQLDNQYRLGFLRNSKRFNVAITRAKALLIVVGNPHILAQDSDWRSLIEYTQENGGYTGCQYQPQIDHQVDSLEQKLHKMIIKDAEEDEVSPYTQYEEPAWRSDQ